MQIIKEEKLNKILKGEEFSWDFEIEKEGIYSLEITASARSWRQKLKNLRSFFRDDDLALKIDDISFPKKNGKRGLFDSEVAWNGNNLKGLKKTDFFLIKFSPGTHKLTFLIDQSPKIETIRVYQIEKEKEISYFPKDNYPPEDGNRRQWLTLALVNLSLKSFKIKASAREGKRFLIFKRDDADLKLIINDQIQKNQEPKSHKYWYWCGRTLKGKSKEFHKELNLKPDLHYIELWADRMPELEEIKIEISKSILFTLSDIRTYTYRGISGNEDYNRFDEEILEAVNEWNKHFFSQERPPREFLDPNLVKAIVYVESRMGYGKGGFPDVMQVADPRNPAIHTLNKEEGYPGSEYMSDSEIGHMSYSYLQEQLPLKIESSKESIFWGVRWLYHKAQFLKTKPGKSKELLYPYQREWISWEESLSGYNPHLWYKDRVLKIYKKGVDQDGNILWKEDEGRQREINPKFLFAGLIFFIGIFALFFSLSGHVLEPLPWNIKIVESIQITPVSHLAILQDIGSAGMGIALLDEKFRLKNWLPQAEYLPYDAGNKSVGEHLEWWKIEEINQDGLKEIAIQLQFAGPANIKSFYLYQQNKNNFDLLLNFKDCSSNTDLVDFNNDSVKEVFHSFSLDCVGMAGRDLTPWKEVYLWKDGKYEKANNLFPEIYQDLLKYYQYLLNDYQDESIIYYRPIVECLKEQAKLNIEGIFADGRGCIKED